MRTRRYSVILSSCRLIIVSGTEPLAERAEARPALSDDDALDRGSATRAGLAFLVVDVEVLLIGAGLAIAVAVIAQRTAAVLKALEQCQANAGVQPRDLVVVEAVAGAQRVQLRQPERLIGVDVAD